MSQILRWDRNATVVASEAYLTDSRLVEKAAAKGYRGLIEEYVYIDSPDVLRFFGVVPGLTEVFRGVGADLGGGVGCISSSIATFASVERVYCVEVVERAVVLAQPIVAAHILGARRDRVVSVVGDFDRLGLPDGSLDFAIAWDSMHHSADPVYTLRECRRVLKPGGHFVVVDRGHNNSTPDEAISAMLDIVYSREWLLKNYRDPAVRFTRREYGEHEYRWREWEAFVDAAGFHMKTAVVIKTAPPRTGPNDAGYPEVLVDFNVGAHLQSKVCYVLEVPS